MGATRQRQVNRNSNDSSNDDSGVYSSPTKDKSHQTPKQCNWLSKKNLILAFFGISTIVYILLATGAKQLGSRVVENVAVSLNLHKPFHVAIIDAGSTASRLNLFTFHKSFVDSQIVLDDTLFYEIKPGLSSFAKQPEKIEESLKVLLDKAKSKIPKSEWSTTPLSMKATAGLRLLPDAEAQRILNECRRIFSESGFQVSNDSVSIMEGSDEGIFSWFTTNFVLDKFSSSGDSEDDIKSTVAAFDLGGGSTQVTFAISPSALQRKSKELAAHEKNLHNINVLDKNISVFTDSFLGLGLMAARKEILTHPDNKQKIEENSSGKVELHAECINPIISGVQWNYGSKNYLVKGALNGSHKVVKAKNSANTDEKRPVVRFSTCLDIIKKVVNDAIPHDLPSLKEHEIYAFSYYFEKATEVGLIDPIKGGVVTVESIYKIAAETCDYPNTDQPFACLDLTFIYVLLSQGFGLDDKTNIFLHKYVNGHQLNWALGAAFHVQQNSL